MTAPEEIVWAAAFANALAAGMNRFKAIDHAAWVVRTLREIPDKTGPERNGPQRMLYEFRTGADDE
jgi:hypothetical protein